MLDRPDSPRDGLHPVMDVGLDDIARGSADLGGLLQILDEACGTALGEVTRETPADAPAPPGAVAQLFAPDDRRAWLMRWIDLREAIVGTTVMWVWELEIADRKLRAAGLPPLMSLPRHERFVVGSLVYNSGILHRRETHRQLGAFSTGDYLHERSEANAARRPRLNLDRPGVLWEELRAGGDYRPQWTSWVAVYHVLQRYGAWTALHRFDRVFDAQGRFVSRQRPAPAPPEPPEVLVTPDASPGVRAQELDVLSWISGGLLGAGALAAMLWLRRR